MYNNIYCFIFTRRSNTPFGTEYLPSSTTCANCGNFFALAPLLFRTFMLY